LSCFFAYDIRAVVKLRALQGFYLRGRCRAFLVRENEQQQSLVSPSSCHRRALTFLLSETG